MYRCVMIFMLLVSPLIAARGGEPERKDPDSVDRQDSLVRVIPDFLSPMLFIPADRLAGIQPWMAAPLLRPVVEVLNVYGTGRITGFGEYEMTHPDRFFSTLAGYNVIDVPQLYLSEQMMIGNTLKLGKRFYFLSGIMYGTQMGVRGNNWGMGTREGVIWHPSELVSVVFWQQYFQSVSVYSPVLFPDRNGDPAAIRMPATPEVFSFGVQATFIVGEFIIGVGTSVAPVPFQKRHHSEFRYR